MDCRHCTLSSYLMLYSVKAAMTEHRCTTTSKAEPAVTASWAGSFCLACDADSHGEPFCSEACTLADSCNYSFDIATVCCAASLSLCIPTPTHTLARPQGRPVLMRGYSATRMLVNRRRALCFCAEPPAPTLRDWPPTERFKAPKPPVVCTLRWDIWAQGNAESLGMIELDDLE